MNKLYAAGIVLIAALIVLGALPKSSQTEKDAIKKFASYDELKNFIQARSEDYAAYRSLGGADVRTAALGAPSATAEQTADSQTKSIDYSSTNIQVEGVDEADIIKNDGKYIYTISGNKVVIVDAYPAEGGKIISEINLSESGLHGMFINGNRLVVFGNSYEYTPLGAEKTGEAAAPFPVRNTQLAFANIYDISDRTNPVLLKNVSADGYYLSSRMIGNYVYMIVNEPAYYYYGRDVPVPALKGAVGFPDIYYFDVPGSSYNFINIVAINADNGAAANKAFLLPYSENIFVSKDNIYLTYTKWLDYRDFFDKFVDEVIIPSFPALKTRIDEIRSYKLGRTAQLAEIQETVENYLQSLNPEEAAAVQKAVQEKMIKFQTEIAKERERTVINKISISGMDIKYVAQGSVAGRPLNQFSMDEHEGYFRIATTIDSSFGGPVIMTTRTTVTDVTVQSGAGSGGSGSSPSSGIAGPVTKPVPNIPGSNIPGAESGAAGEVPTDTSNEASPDKPISSDVTPSPIIEFPIVEPPRSNSVNNLYILDAGMNIVGKLEDLAPGERIYSARFMGDRAYMATFRQIDPLFAIDLSDPASPKVLGQLKVTGVSQYIHPVDDNHIIGVGKEATEQGFFQGLKMSLFDVSDVSNPKEISKFTIGDRGSDSRVLYDHKAFLYSPSKKLLVIPVMVAEIDKSKLQEMPTWAYGEPKWQGAYVFTIDENGFKVVGRVSHATNETEGYQFYYGQYAVSRSLYIDNVIYTMSSRLLKANQLPGLEEIKSIELPGYGLIGLGL